MGNNEVMYHRPLGLSGVELLRLDDSSMPMQPHFHDAYVVWLNGSGAEQYAISGNRGILQPDSFSIIAPGDVHANSALTDRRTLLSLYIDEQAISEAAASITDGGNGAFRTGIYRDRQSRAALTRLHGLLLNAQNAMTAKTAFLETMALLLGRHGAPAVAESGPRDAGRAGQAAGIMRDRMAEPLTLEDVAVECGCTEYHLIRLFRREFGITPHAYLMKLRLEQARIRIASGMCIAEAAADCGFTDQSHLTRHFRSRFGLPPGQYRRQVNSVQDPQGRVA